jgi:hypothetical protein
MKESLDCSEIYGIKSSKNKNDKIFDLNAIT